MCSERELSPVQLTRRQPEINTFYDVVSLSRFNVLNVFGRELLFDEHQNVLMTRCIVFYVALPFNQPHIYYRQTKSLYGMHDKILVQEAQ